MNNKNTNKNNGSGLPVLIIVGVLLIAVIGGWWFYTTSKADPTATSNSRPSNTTKPPANQPQATPKPITSNEPGAQPPHFKGAQNAPVVVEEFSDFQCPTCAAVYPAINEISSTYGSRVKVIVRNFPLTQIHQNAYDAAVAAEAAGLQGKFWDMQNLIFQNQQRWSTAPNARALFESYAGILDLDVEKFKDDMSGMTAKQRVDADIQRGRALGISGTPTIFVNGKTVPPEMMTGVGFKQIIESEIKLASSGQTQTAPPPKPADNTAANASNSKPANK